MQKQHQGPPARMTEANLAEAAASYLARYASSSGNLRRVLVRKVKRSAAHYGDAEGPLLAGIEAIVRRFLANGAVDDRHYAQNQIQKLRGRGASARKIAERLMLKGVPRETIEETSDGPASVAGDLEAALRYARRRRLGPFRAADRDLHRQRDLAALGRAGFDYTVSATLIDAPDAESAVAALEQR
jgi:regulatory protein